MSPHLTRTLLLAPVLSCALLTAVACSSSSAQSVVVSPARTQTLSLSPGGFGTVQAGVDRAIVYSRHARVLAVNVRDGQQVAAGDVLATVSTVGISVEAARLNNLLQADQKLLQQLKLTVGDNNPQTIATLGRISDERRQLNAAQGPTDLAAPIAGVVGNLTVNAGASVDGGDVLMHVVDSRSAVVVAAIPLEYRSYLTKGMKVQVSLPGTPNSSLDADLTEVNDTQNADGTAVDTTFELTSAASRPALGARAYVRLALSTSQSVVVNSLAVSQTAESPFVFVVRGDQVRMQQVKLGLSDGTWTQILSGLQAGDQVVVAGAQELRDGSKIHITQRQA